MRIICRYCGERPLEEFSFLGDASVQRPSSLQAEALSDWMDYVYLRDNPRGQHKEYWQHSAGCRSWLVVERDTLSHEVYQVQAAKDSSRVGPS